MKVAVLGLGAMGSAMAGTLSRAGHSVTVWNRGKARLDAVRDAFDVDVADSPAAAVSVCDVAISMLADRVAVEEVFLAAGGVLEGAHERLVACEMSTVEPEVSQSLADRMATTGADLLDTPVSGSVTLMEQGALTIMVGGRAETLSRARPVLEALSSRIFHMGDVGSGAAMKLAVNAIVHGLNQALSEGLVLAEAAGIPRALAYEVFDSSAAGAPFVHYKKAAFENPDEASVAFRLALVQKDIELILAFGQRLGVPLTQMAANLDVVNAAVPQFGDRDMSVLAQYLRLATSHTSKESNR